MNAPFPFFDIAEDLELAGLVWCPEIGDEVLDRDLREMVSILVDPQGMTPTELRSTYLWLPTVEQMVMQLESRQAILFHAGLELSSSSFCYKAIVQAPQAKVEAEGESLRAAVGYALRDLLLSDHDEIIN